MAYVLISRMELPKEGTTRLTLYPDGRVTTTNPYNEAVIGTDSHAREVPNHDELVRMFDNLTNYSPDVFDYECAEEAFRDVLFNIGIRKEAEDG